MICCKGLLGPVLVAILVAACAGWADSTSPVSPTQASRSRIAPLTTDTIASCPVTLPNDKRPTPDPGIRWPPTRRGIGNENATLFTGVGPIVFTPNGAGVRNPDGSLGIKHAWYRTIRGDVVIAGHRLDAPAPPLPVVVLRGPEDGYGETGFHTGGLLFPSEGCWEVTGSVGIESLTFVALVVSLNFDTPLFRSWPAGELEWMGADVSGFPTTIRQTYASPSGGSFKVQTTLGPSQFLPNPETSPISLVVRGSPGLCVHGGADEQGRWQPDLDAAYLEWTAADMTYRIDHVRLGLSCLDLLHVAGSYFLPR